MEFVCCKKYNKKGIDNVKRTINIGTKLDVVDNQLWLGNNPICEKTSKDGHDFFALNSDEKGQERFDLTHKIYFRLMQIKFGYDEEVAEVYKTFDENTKEEDKLEELAKVEDSVALAYRKIKLINPIYLKQDSETFSYFFWSGDIETLDSVLAALNKIRVGATIVLDNGKELTYEDYYNNLEKF